MEVIQRVSWQDAISVVCAAEIDALESEGAVGPDSVACIAVPNSLDLDAQDRLRRAVDARCRKVTLLWRPVAAALSWLDRFEPELRRTIAPAPDGSLGRLLVVDLGLAAFEITALDLVRTPEAEDDRIVVARPLPDLPVLHGEGVRIADLLAFQAARATQSDLLDVDSATAWNLLWCTGFLAEVINGAGSLSTEGFDLSAGRAWLARFGAALIGRGRCDDAARTVVSALMPAGAYRRPRLSLPATSWPCDRVPRWLDELHLRNGSPFLGTVAVGPLSGAPCSHKRLGEMVASIVAPQAVEQRVLTEGSDGSLIAVGAARFETLRQDGQVPYLDSLPDIQTLLQRRGEPEWANLGPEGSRYVPGGVPWDGHVPGSFAVRAEEQELQLTVCQEGEPTVREVDVSFPRPVEQETPVTLHVSLTPGQGNPRVEVIPQNPIIFAGRRFYLDWRRCEDTGKTMRQAADEMERIFPPLEPRQASWECWHEVDAKIRHFVKNMTSSDLRARKHLKDIRRLLRQKDKDRATQTPPEHATSIGSDGAAIATPNSSRYLEKFESMLVSWLEDSTATTLHSDIYGVLGYCSSNDERLANRLRQLIAFPKKIKPHHLIAFGNCLRDSTQIAAFAAAAVARRVVTNDWLRALARILQYRADATEYIEDDSCYALLDIAHRAMQIQLSEGKASFIYRHASLCVAYLLRRRAYSAGFLDPQSTQAQEIKKTMERAVAGLRARKIVEIGGFVDLVEVTKLIIDYIDRRGKGRIVLLTD